MFIFIYLFIYLSIYFVQIYLSFIPYNISHLYNKMYVFIIINKLRECVCGGGGGGGGGSGEGVNQTPL